MSLGLGLFRAIYREGIDSLSVLHRQGVGEALFTQEEAGVFQFIEQHSLQYGRLPSVSLIRADMGTEKCVVWEHLPDEPLQYWIDRLRERDILLSARSCTVQLEDAISHRDIQQVQNLFAEGSTSLRSLVPQQNLAVYPEAVQGVVEIHDRLQQLPSPHGVPFAFPSLNEASGGLFGGDIIGYVGVSGTCKSYLLLNDALAAHRAGFSVLFHSMEMPVEQCVRRLTGLRTGVDPSALRKGMVTFFGMERVRAELSNGDMPFPITGGSLGTLNDFRTQIKYFHPDIAYLDGAYLLRLPHFRGQRWERCTEVLEGLKEAALSGNIPIEFTYQFNRKNPGTLEGISFTSAVEQLSSLVMSISLEVGIREEIRNATIHIMKGREGETAMLRATLDFKYMRFTEEGFSPREEQIEEGREDFGAENSELFEQL